MRRPSSITSQFGSGNLEQLLPSCGIIYYNIVDTLDGKQISETAKQFLKNWHANKETQKQKRAEVLRRGGSFIDDFAGKYQNLLCDLKMCRKYL